MGTGELKDERNEADLREVEPEILFQDWIDGRNQRLHHVVEQMAEAEGRENLERRGHAVWLVGSWWLVVGSCTTNH